MLKFMRKLHGAHGQSIATVGLMSVFLLAILGMAADTGYVWLQRRNLQNSADAAALAQKNISIVSIFERSPTSGSYFTGARFIPGS